MLSDVEIPLLDLSADDPVDDYVRALALLEATGAARRRPRSRARRDRTCADVRPRTARTSPRSSPGVETADERCALPWTAAAHEAQREAVGR